MEVPAIQIQTDRGLASKYADSIDLSNACRAFYQARLESTRRLKEKWRDNGEMDCSGESEDGQCNSKISSLRRRGSNSSGSSSRRGSDSDGGGGGGGGGFSSGCSRGGRTDGRKMTSLDVAIDVLRREMAALMDQDLCLMKQLLTLNEEIEDLKWRRRYGWSRASSFCSSDNMIQSAASLGKVDEHPKLQFLTPSSLSLQLDGSTTRLSIYNEDDPVGTFNRSASTNTSTTNVNSVNSKVDNKDVNDSGRTVSNQNSNKNEDNTSSWCGVNGHCNGTGNRILNCEDSTDINIKLSNSEQILGKSAEIDVSSRVCHKVEGEQRCNENTHGCSSTTQVTESSASTVNATYLNMKCGRNISRTFDKLISKKGPMSSRNKGTKKLVDADVESQDSGIHDCFGTA